MGGRLENACIVFWEMFFFTQSIGQAISAQNKFHSHYKEKMCNESFKYVQKGITQGVISHMGRGWEAKGPVKIQVAKTLKYGM